MGFIDCDDIELLNKKAIGRPPLTENLLPFLGKKNLLFQPTGHDDGKFVKSLRMQYGSMVIGEMDSAPQIKIHDVAFDTMSKRTKHWDQRPIDVFEELKHILYDVMGDVLFGAAWSSNSRGAEIIKTHRCLIEHSASLGLSCCEEFTLRNLLKLPSDYRCYQNAIKRFHALCWEMIEERRAEVQA